MKKIVAIIGSPRKYDSVTFQIVEKILNEIKKRKNDVECSLVHLALSDVSMCKGCGLCFQSGCGCVQYVDDVKSIEDEMLNADLIIFASPVYAHGVTGMMKNFIDRISYWLHLMRLMGKYGVVISVSDSNGNIYVDEYLGKIMEFMGLSVIDKLDFIRISGWEIDELDSKVDRIVYYLNNNNKIINYETKNEIFKIFKKIYKTEYLRLKELGIEESNIPNEILYWKNHGYFECDDFRMAFELNSQ